MAKSLPIERLRSSWHRLIFSSRVKPTYAGMKIAKKYAEECFNIGISTHTRKYDAQLEVTNTTTIYYAASVYLYLLMKMINTVKNQETNGYS